MSAFLIRDIVTDGVLINEKITYASFHAFSWRTRVFSGYGHTVSDDIPDEKSTHPGYETKEHCPAK
jgi:hypothetical protein